MKIFAKYITITAFTAALLGLAGGDLLCSDFQNDNTDRLSQNQSYTFAPGYINAAKQKAEEVMRQTTEKKRSFLENAMEYINDKLGRNVKEKAMDKEALQLLKKSGSSDSDQNAALSTTTTTYEGGIGLVDSSQYNVTLGSGDNKRYYDRATNAIYDTAGGGRVLLSEVINGVRHIYAGFDNYGTSESALSRAMSMATAGDRIIVKSGTYTGNLTIKSGVSLYGGYNEDGVRDLTNAASVISNSTFSLNKSNDVEINGFTFRNSTQMPISVTDSSNVTIMNSDIAASDANRYLVHLIRSSAVIKNNLFSNNQYGVVAGYSTVTVDHNTFNNIVYDALYSTTSTISSSNNNFLTVGRRYIYNYTGANPTSTGDYFSGNAAIVRTTVSNSSTTLIETRAQDSQLLSAIRTPVTTTTVSADKNTLLTAIDNRYTDMFRNYNLPGVTFSDLNKVNAMSPESMSNMFKAILRDQGPMPPAGFSNSGDQERLMNIIRDSLDDSALVAPDAPSRTQAMGIGLMLAAIMRNPTEDQKAMIDSVSALLNDMSKIEEGVGQSPELTKAQSELIRMLCNILLAQAVPDLLKEGDMANIKDVFKELDARKASVMADYQKAAGSYYESVKEDLIKNMAALQLNNVLSKGMLEREIKDASRSEIDKILEKLRKSSDKFMEKEDILSREARYRNDYLVSGAKKFENDMKMAIVETTKRLQESLKAKK